LAIKIEVCYQTPRCDGGASFSIIRIGLSRALAVVRVCLIWRGSGPGFRKSERLRPEGPAGRQDKRTAARRSNVAGAEIERGSKQMSDVAERVKKIVVEHLGVEPEKVVDKASFIDDLGADSLDIVELVMAFE